jgi:membrane-associated phospholipid phosphatase
MSRTLLLTTLLFLFLLLALINPLLSGFNKVVRRAVNRTRDLRMRPLIVLTHQWNDGPLLSLQVILIALFLGLASDDWRRPMVLSSAMFLQTTLVGVAKKLTAVTRPPQRHAHRVMKSGSYPSGHTAAALTFALLVPPILSPYLAPVSLVVISAILAFNAVLTAYGRLYLDVHWLTDILGAALLSLATRVAGSFFL